MDFNFDFDVFCQTFGVHTRYNTCQYKFQDDTLCNSEIVSVFHPCCEAHCEIYHDQLEVFIGVRFPVDLTISTEVHISLEEDIEPKKNKANFENIPKMPEIVHECPVCFEKNEILILPCHHTICCFCFNSLEKDICALCRCQINFSLIRKI